MIEKKMKTIKVFIYFLFFNYRVRLFNMNSRFFTNEAG